MKLIDHTPYLTEKGEISTLHKLLGTIRFGDFWVEEIKAQKAIIEELDRSLAPGYTLLRNIQLPGSKITYPMVLVGPAGIPAGCHNPEGQLPCHRKRLGFGNKGETRPVRPNLTRQTSRMALALQKHLERFGLDPGQLRCADRR